MVTAYFSNSIVAGAARVDTNGNVTPDSNLSSYVPGSAEGFPSPLNYLGGPDGTLWASSTSGAVVSDVVDVQATGGVPVSDYSTPAGQGNSYRAARSAHWIDADTDQVTVQGNLIYKDCGGFDDKAPAILVVPLNGTNQVQLKVEGAFLQRNAWQAVTLQSDTPSVTVANPSGGTGPTGGTTLFMVHGGATPVLARIKAINSNGQNLATLRVAVKNQISSFLDLYPIVEANEPNIPTPSVPTSSNVLTELNSVFTKQANMAFTVTSQAQVSAVYDLAQPPIQALLYPAANILGYQEVGNILTAITVPPFNGNSDHKWALYLHAISPVTTEGYAPVPTPPIPPGGFAVMQDLVPGYASSGQVYVTAHETGHTFGLHHSNALLDLMVTPDPGVSPCRIHEPEWHSLNPTPGEDQPPSAAD